jgi:uracil-DNA glycosylase
MVARRRIPVVEAPVALDTLLAQARACRVCEAQLPHGPRPVLQASASARVLIVGQAPGARVHDSGVPWDDKSGERLRAWMGIDAARFYDATQVAIIPSGLCYPGKAASGDRPPRPECAPRWLHPLRAQLHEVRLTLAVGQYAQREILGRAAGADLTATVRDWRRFAPACFPLPHPSPRNVAWFKANPWFEAEVLPALRAAVAQALAHER